MNKIKRSYQARVCVPAPEPVRCPKCHGQSTVADGGVHYNVQTEMRYEYRACPGCLFRFVAARKMTEKERIPNIGK